MFRDLREYQNLQKLYEEKVSKPENLVEKVNDPGSGVKSVKVELEKKINVKPNTDLNAVSKYMDNNRKEVTMSDFKSSTPENNNQKIDTSNEIESDANYAKTNARFNQRFNKDVKIVRNSQMSGKQRAQEMAKKRIAAKKAGTYEKPKTAQELAKERIAAKKRLANIKVEDYSPYEMVLEYLLSSEQATTIEEANYVMMQLDEENIQEIVRTIMKTPLVKLIPAAGATIATTKFVASKLGQKSGENQIKNSTTPAPVGDEKKKKGNFLTNFINKKRNQKGGGNYRVDEVEKNAGVESGYAGEKIKF
tara:strand:+ start:210 stop:1127 length:918 start_codon:yes stop_codon:yes gene_type:complete